MSTFLEDMQALFAEIRHPAAEKSLSLGTFVPVTPSLPPDSALILGYRCSFSFDQVIGFAFRCTRLSLKLFTSSCTAISIDVGTSGT